MSITTLTADDDDSFLYLFARPCEPLFIPKGEKRFTFDLPEDYYLERYRPLSTELQTRFAVTEGNRVLIERTGELPDLSLPLQLGRNDCFSLFIPKHCRLASALIEIFMNQPTRKDFLAVSAYCRDRINPQLYIYALSVALQHRDDTRNIPIPSMAEIFPDRYIYKSVFTKAKEESFAVPFGSRVPLEIPRDYTASDLDEEHRIAYFREDLGINLHHSHWHLVYPNDAPRKIVDKDRRGELFYYMHRQIIARYNCERLCNKLARVKRLLNWRQPIPEAYFPKLDNLVASRVWPSRSANTLMMDIDREVDEIHVDVQDLELWRDRILRAIHTGRVENDKGEEVLLTEMGGIDTLGNIVESCVLSVNRNLYGDLHNMGHIIIANSHDPDNKHLEAFGVMGDSTTAMRDPVFYRWHAFIDDLFQEHKNTLPRYTYDQLNFPGVRIASLEVQVEGQDKNTLATFWQQSDVDLSRGLDFTQPEPIFARFTHLQHAPFNYVIKVENSGAAKRGMVRIFMAPKFDERGVPFLFREQRLFFIELDKFTVDLEDEMATIDRSSKESSVTIPSEQMFRTLQANQPSAAVASDEFKFCGCGWPHHMLIPRGSGRGFPFQLFVMISNYEDDRVKQPSGTRMEHCTDAASYCGIRDSLYPDKRSMGYPFDRQPRSGVETLQQFLTPNMAVQDVNIIFVDRIMQRKPVTTPTTT